MMNSQLTAPLGPRLSYSGYLPNNGHMGTRAGEYQGHIWPRPAAHEGHIWPRAGERERHSPALGGFYHTLPRHHSSRNRSRRSLFRSSMPTGKPMTARYGVRRRTASRAGDAAEPSGGGGGRDDVAAGAALGQGARTTCERRSSSTELMRPAPGARRWSRSLVTPNVATTTTAS